jgi:Zn-dependent metalloprotease
MRKSGLLVLIGVSALLLECGSDAPTGSASSVVTVRGIEPAFERRDVPALSGASLEDVRVLWDRASDRPRQVRGRFAVAERNAVSAARAFLGEHRDLFRLDASPRGLAFERERKGLAGTYVRFQQQHSGQPIFGAEVVVLVVPSEAGSEIRAATLGHADYRSVASAAADIGQDSARQIAASAGRFDPATETIKVERGSLVSAASELRPAYRVTFSAQKPARAEQIDVDAETAAVLGTRDLLQRITGSGMVFDPNPVASTGNTALTDNNELRAPRSTPRASA